MKASFMAVLAVLSIAAGAPAQSIPEGARVRLTPATPSPVIVGQLIAVSDSTVVVRRHRNKGDITIPRSVVLRLEVSRGTNRGRSAGWGALLGLAIGGAVGFAAGEDSCGGDAWFCFRRPVAALLGALPGVAAGTLIGLLVGSVERWQDTDVPSSLSIVPTSDGSLAIVSRIPF